LFNNHNNNGGNNNYSDKLNHIDLCNRPFIINNNNNNNNNGTNNNINNSNITIIIVNNSCKNDSFNDPRGDLNCEHNIPDCDHDRSFTIVGGAGCCCVGCGCGGCSHRSGRCCNAQSARDFSRRALFASG
jgi:hypothetical protein